MIKPNLHAQHDHADNLPVMELKWKRKGNMKWKLGFEVLYRHQGFLKLGTRLVRADSRGDHMFGFVLCGDASYLQTSNLTVRHYWAALEAT